MVAPVLTGLLLAAVFAAPALEQTGGAAPRGMRPTATTSPTKQRRRTVARRLASRNVAASRSVSDGRPVAVAALPKTVTSPAKGAQAKPTVAPSPDRPAATIVAAVSEAQPAAGASAQSKATYVGAANCQMCHSEVHKSWSAKPHSRAFDLLVAKKQDKNEACLKCHTTGYGRGGFVDAEKTPGLRNVTCEACHGPGSEHNGDKAKITRVPPATVCTACHLKSDIH